MISKDVLEGKISKLEKDADTIELNIKELLKKTSIEYQRGEDEFSSYCYLALCYLVMNHFSVVL